MHLKTMYRSLNCRIRSLIKRSLVTSKTCEKIRAKDYLAQEIIPLSSLTTFTVNVHDLNESINCLEKIPGVLSPIEGLTLLFLSAYGSGNEPVIEVGSYLGKSTSYIALGCKIASKKGVYTIDLFPGADDWYLGNDGYYHIHGSGYSLAKARYDERSTFIYKGGYQNTLDLFKDIMHKVGLKDVITPFKGTSSAFAESIQSGTKFRMIFIDADHSYEGVSRDIFSLVNLLIDDGIFCFHDYSKGFPGVLKAVNEHIISSKDFSDFLLVGNLLIAKKCKSNLQSGGKRSEA